uniref:RNA binding motif protein 19 n=1 Tax=Pavo cristatus TaxID=9049 RepID=A0A8C9F6J3_PAVCR
MSRLIVKNLPNGMKEDRFRKLFAAFGTLTDCCLKFTKDGKFRKFGFIGYKSEDEAQAALSHFNRSFIDTSRVTVELCKSFGDPSKPKAWSKHSQKVPALEKQPEKPMTIAAPASTKKDKKKKNPSENLKELEEDKTFQEFLVVHQKRSQVATWANDTLAEEPKKEKSKPVADYLNFDSDESEDLSEEEKDGTKKQQEKKAAMREDLSDMDYLKSKVVRDSSSYSSSGTEEETDSEEVEEESKNEDSGLTENIGTHTEKRRKSKPQEAEQETPAEKKKKGSMLEVELNYASITLRAGASWDSMCGRYVEVSRCENTPKETVTAKTDDQPWQRMKRDDEEEEDLSESGRLFVRNLPFTSTEEDLEKIFSKYGPLSEIHFPIDRLTKKPKGFAFITYMIPEHAVKAYAEMDGQVFQGRMMHLLPSTIKKEKIEDIDAEESSSYKKQKEAKDKANSASSHNWNTLFVGTNAVADAIAQKYNASKSQVLDHESKDSVAVRVALGETELVQEIRRFLIENGVRLDSFSQAAGERSKTVILVKNLPATTSTAELEAIFGKHGSLGRVLLPTGGITAIVEFLEPTEAKQAFTKLAYSKVSVARGCATAWRMLANCEAAEKISDKGCLNSLQTFSKVGAVKSCTISKKKDKAGALLSMGFGFVEYKKPESAQKALRRLQVMHLTCPFCSPDRPAVKSSRKKQTVKKQKTSKILVRNIPFQATVREIRELFSTFGELKTVRLPKKMAGTGSHRGFGFVDFLTKQDAKKAFNALCHSTHLYGRRLVLEWADTEETVEALRRRTADHFHGKASSWLLGTWAELHDVCRV